MKPKNEGMDEGRDWLKDVYGKHLDHPECQVLTGDVEREALCFDPFYQLMRQQLLCSAMQKSGEMDAEVVSLMHVAPKANGELMNRVTSPELKALGSNIHEIWSSIAAPGCFKGVAVEDLLPLVRAKAPSPDCGTYLEQRYSGMARGR